MVTPSGVLRWCAAIRANAVALVVLLGIMLPTTLAAQAAPDEMQRRLNQEGLSALEAGDTDHAVKLFRAALEVGELDLLYLNLGRALQKLGECQDAVQSLDKALTAPTVGTPPHDVIVGLVAQYKGELRESCDGIIVLICDPPDLKLTMDGTEQACGVELEIAPGQHTFAGEYDGRSVSVTVTVHGLDRAEVAVTLPAAEVVPVIPEPDDSAAPLAEGDAVVAVEAHNGGWRPAAAWTLAGLGVASLATGVVFSFLTGQTNDDIAAYADDRRASTFDTEHADGLQDDLSTYGTLQLVTYGLGAVLTGAGVFLLFWNDDGAHAWLVPSSSPDMPASVVIEGRF